MKILNIYFFPTPLPHLPQPILYSCQTWGLVHHFPHLSSLLQVARTSLSAVSNPSILLDPILFSATSLTSPPQGSSPDKLDPLFFLSFFFSSYSTTFSTSPPCSITGTCKYPSLSFICSSCTVLAAIFAATLGCVGSTDTSEGFEEGLGVASPPPPNQLV